MTGREEFFEYLKARGLAWGTIALGRFYLDMFFSYLTRQGVETPRDVRPSHVWAYRELCLRALCPRKKTRLAGRTVYNRLHVVAAYFRYLAERKVVLLNPAEGLARVRLNEALPKNVPTEKDIRALIEAPDVETSIGVRDRAILEVMYSTGLRRQEVVNLNLDDVDFKAGVVYVRQGKRRKDRVVPMGRGACAMLLLYRDRVRRMYLHPRRRGRALDRWEAALFISQFGKRLTAAGLSLLVRGYARRVFPHKALGCHVFRHACATHMIRHGASARLVQELLGHKSLTSTQIYTRICPSDLKEAHRRCHPRGKGLDFGRFESAGVDGAGTNN